MINNKQINPPSPLFKVEFDFIFEAANFIFSRIINNIKKAFIICLECNSPLKRGLGGLNAILISIFLLSCEKKPEPQAVIIPEQSEQGVFIVNEGNFTFGNSSLSYYDINRDSVENNIFYRVNDIPLGDVAQSMKIYNGLAYIIVNNSGIIQVIDAKTFEYKGKITGLSSPRDICFIDNSKAYVSDLYSNAISVINPTTFEISGSINIKHNSENFVQIDNKIYTNSWSFGNTINIIDAATNTYQDSIIVGIQPRSMALDKNNNLWVLTDGGFAGSTYGNENAKLHKINTSTNIIEQTLEFTDINLSPSDLCLNETKDTLFYIANNVYKMSINSNELPSQAIISNENSQTFYSLNIDKNNYKIYVSDCKDYTQSGDVYIYSTNGALISKLAVGINPGDFCFVDK